ncbi:MAG TPA: cysteine desulfurase family protein [Desulfomonilaceae bacterium]|nr:cysteine desulfurase family protein [Desulfomonilaceae bacterium]
MSASKPVYLDYNGTTPHDPQVLEAMKLFLEEEFGNPSSNHWYGIAPKKAIRTARERVAELLNCSPDEIFFTSGGTESNNHAIIGTAFANRHKGNHIVTSGIEHPAVLEVCHYLEAQGFSVTYLPVDEFGLVSVSDAGAAITPRTILITVMHANNEVGTVEPIAEIAALAREREIVVHTDAAQSIGKIPANVAELGVDLLSIAGHKVYAPKGIGVLYVRSGTKLQKFMLGAGQESGRRAGTENVTQVVGLGRACELAKKNLEEHRLHMKRMRDLLHSGLAEHLPDLRLNGHPEKRLPNTLSLSFYGLEANRILEEIGLDVAASAGAACHSDHVEVSHVLQAMGVPLEWAKGTLRFSTGRMTTEAEINRAVQSVVNAVNELKRG